MKKRPLTEERLKHLQAALEDNAKQIERKVNDAVRTLTEARRDA